MCGYNGSNSLISLMTRVNSLLVFMPLTGGPLVLVFFIEIPNDHIILAILGCSFTNSNSNREKENY